VILGVQHHRRTEPSATNANISGISAVTNIANDGWKTFTRQWSLVGPVSPTHNRPLLRLIPASTRSSAGRTAMAGLPWRGSRLS